MDLRQAAFFGLKPIDTKIHVKPVFVFLAHHGDKEGPCRTGTPESLSPENERRRAEASYAGMMDRIRIQSPFAKVMAPVFIEHGDDWLVKASEYAKLDGDAAEVDIYLVTGQSLNQFFAVKLGERYQKPVAMVGGEQDPALPMMIDAGSHLRSKGLEAYLSVGWEAFDDLLKLLYARKAMRATRVLRVTQGQFDNVNGSFLHPTQYQERLGMEMVDIPIKGFAEAWDRVREDPDAWQLAQDTAEALVAQAQGAHIDTAYVANDVAFYLAAKSLMETYGCNAFTVDCFEICPDGRMAVDRKVVPCLTHVLNKDQGMPSSCEGDLGVLAALMLVQSVAQRTAYMGNLFLVDREQNLIKILHDVPGLKLKGYDAPDVPYDLRNFAVEGWGTTVRYDFCQDKGQPVTVARVSPGADKLMVTKAVIAGCGGFDTPSCSLEVVLQVEDAVAFFQKAMDVGNHSAMVYGDWSRELRALGELLGLEVIEA
jgi:L-fucose isomerase-like protein